MITTAETFLANLHKAEAVPALTIAWGEEAYYKDSILAALLAKIFPNIPETERSVIVFDQEVNFAALREAINTYPFFSGKNFIIIKEPKLLAKEKTAKESGGEKKKEGSKELLTILADIPDYTHVLCLCGKLDKRGIFYKNMSKSAVLAECSSLKSYSLKPWLEAQAASYGAKFTYQATALIMEYMSVTDTVPLLLLQGEIAKLAIYAGQRKSWTAEDVESIFSQLPEISGFALGNAISNCNIAKAMELLAVERKKGSGNFIPVLARVSFEIRRLCNIKELMQTGAGKEVIAAQLHMHPYAVQLMLTACRNFTLAQLKKTLVALAELNMQLRKGGRQWPRLEEIILNLLINKNRRGQKWEN